MKPIDADIWLIYECECGLRNEARVEETRFPGGWRCSCGKENRYDEISSLTLTPNYSKPILQMKKVVSLSPNKLKAINILKIQGFTKGEAKKLVENINETSVEGIVKCALQTYAQPV